MTATQTATHEIRFRYGQTASLIRGITNALLFAGADATLPALAVVRFEHDGAELRLVATDRYRLVIEKVEHQNTEDVMEPGSTVTTQRKIIIEPFVFSLQRDAAKSLLGLLKANKLSPISLAYTGDTGTLRVQALDTSAEYRTDRDHTFPAYKSLIPAEGSEVEVSEIGFNPKYLADLAKVQLDSRIGAIKIRLYGTRKPTRIDYQDGPTLVLMPVNVDGTVDSSWGAA